MKGCAPVKSIVRCCLYICIINMLFSFPAAASEPEAVEYYNTGRSLQNKEDWYGAIESYREAVRVNSSYGAAWQALAECTYALGEYESALGYLNTAASYLKNTTAIRNLQGFCYIGLGRLDEARSLFASILKDYPNDADARFGLAELDIFDGKISSAEQYYLDALKRQPRDRKSLLSLALVSEELGKTAESKKYIDQALKYHGDSPEVHYFAGYLAAQEGLWSEAEGKVRSAIRLKNDYDSAWELLSSILYNMGRYQEVADVCDLRIARTRALPSAWYIKGLALYRLGRTADAIAAFTTGLEIDGEDEIMRAALELIISETLDLEDPQRDSWALWHIQKAENFQQNYASSQAMYEYRRALKLNPYNQSAREGYAKLFLSAGYPQRYLDQLHFIQAQGQPSTAITDAAEAYQSLLRNSLPARWKIDPFYLDKAHYSIGFYYMDNSLNILHPDSHRITASLLSDVLSSESTIRVSFRDKPVSGYSEAFRLARQNRQDYFCLVSFEENERDVRIVCRFYVARTGSEAAELSAFRTGNDRYSGALRQLVSSIKALLPVRGKLIARSGSNGLIDLGTADGAQQNQQFLIIRQGQLNTADTGTGVLYDESNVLGTFTLTAAGEDVSQGTLKSSGFYDRINTGDEVLLVPPETAMPAPAAEKQQLPSLIRMIQSIN